MSIVGGGGGGGSGVAAAVMAGVAVKGGGGGLSFYANALGGRRVNPRLCRLIFSSLSFLFCID